MNQLYFNVQEKELLVAAMAYEVYDHPIMSDNTYDILCKNLGPTSIKDFQDYTGQWVHNYTSYKPLKELTEACIESYKNGHIDMRIIHQYSLLII